MRASPAVKIYVFLGVALIAAGGVLAAFAHQSSAASELTVRELKDMKDVRLVGQEIYEHLRKVQFLEERIGAGNLDDAKVLELLRKHNIKDPSDSRVSSVTHKTHIEELRTLKLQDEFLESIVKFLMDVERINKNKIRVKLLRLSRSSKDKDYWTADITIAQVAPKKL